MDRYFQTHLFRGDVSGVLGARHCALEAELFVIGIHALVKIYTGKGFACRDCRRQLLRSRFT